MFSGSKLRKHISAFFLTLIITLLILSVASVIFAFFPPPDFVFRLFYRYSYILSGFVAAFFVARASSSRGFLAGIIASDSYIAVLLLLGALVFGTKTDISSIARIFAFSSLFGAIGGTIGINCK